MDANGMYGEKTRWGLNKDATCCFEQILEVTLHKTAAVELLTWMICWVGGKMNKVLGTAGESRTNLSVTFSYGFLHMYVAVLADQQTLTPALWKLDVV